MISFTHSPFFFMAMVEVVLLILGCLMDPAPIIIALAPLLAPIAKQYGIPDVQFGLVFVVTALVGLVTPPVGIILFMSSSLSNVPVERVAWAMVPYMLWMVIVCILMMFFPFLTMWLPTTVGMWNMRPIATQGSA